MASINVTVDASKYEDSDDCLAAAAEDYAAEHDIEGWDLSPRWADDQREEIVLSIPEHAHHVHCECGTWSGVRCEWRGPKSETVEVDYIPEHLRDDHRKAANMGRYPANGAVRLRVERSCADRIIEEAGEWASLV